MKIFRPKQDNAPLPREGYTTATDFCRIFAKDMNRLYLLSLLLTADPELAEKCFVRGLEDSKGGNPVFKEWAQSWARRAIITNAIGIVRPRPDNSASDSVPECAFGDVEGLPAEFAAVASLRTFERFAFVMSVLEGYSDRDCRMLLDCSSSDVAQGRIRALEQLGASAEWHGKLPDDLRKQFELSASAPVSPGMISRLAVSA